MCMEHLLGIKHSNSSFTRTSFFYFFADTKVIKFFFANMIIGNEKHFLGGTGIYFLHTTISTYTQVFFFLNEIMEQFLWLFSFPVCPLKVTALASSLFRCFSILIAKQVSHSSSFGKHSVNLGILLEHTLANILKLCLLPIVLLPHSRPHPEYEITQIPCTTFVFIEASSISSA